jgi:hypothetical protein
MALGGLTKEDKRKDADQEALKKLEKGAQLDVNHAAASKAVFKRFNFSLTQQVSDDIDELSLVPRKFRANRSDVIKAGVVALQRMPEEKLIELLAEVAGHK